MGHLNYGMLTREWARTQSNAPFFRWRLIRGLLRYGLKPVAEAPDTVDVGVVGRCLYTGPDAADVYVHRAAGGPPPRRSRTPDQLSATHGHPRGLRQGYKQAELLRSQVYPIALYPGCVVLRIQPEVSRL